MNAEYLTHARKGLLKYILYHYPIENKDAVWLLNFLKDHDHLKNFVCSLPTEKIKEGLTVTEQFNIIFHYKGLFLTDADVIINLLPELDEAYYLYFTFDDEKIRHQMHLEYWYQQINQRTIPEHIQLTHNEKNDLLKYIEAQIELSLIVQDRNDFDFFSKLLIQLKDG